MKRLTTRSIATATAIRDREPFDTSGALRARRYPDGGMGPFQSGYLSGADEDKWRLDCYHVDYVVWSYSTPIAWHWTVDDETQGWHVVAQKFSPTTSKHQGNLYLIDANPVHPASAGR